jgi:hypothetical protein
MEILGKGLALVGLAAFLGGHYWMAACAFRRSAFWGLGVLFIPGGVEAFVFQRWAYAKRPFLVRLAGIALMLAGGFMLSS